MSLRTSLCTCLSSEPRRQAGGFNRAVTCEVGLAVDRGNLAIGITTVAIALADSTDQTFPAVRAIGISGQIDDAKLECLSRDMLRLGKTADHRGW